MGNEKETKKENKFEFPLFSVQKCMGKEKQIKGENKFAV
jgi:hypothetical protein